MNRCPNRVSFNHQSRKRSRKWTAELPFKEARHLSRQNAASECRKKESIADQFSIPTEIPGFCASIVNTLRASTRTARVYVIGTFLAALSLTTATAQTPTEQLPPAWLPEAEEILIVQDYPTLSTATKGIGRNLRQTIGEVLLSADGIAIVNGKRTMAVDSQTAIAQSVQREFPNVEVRVLKSIGDAREKEICISTWLDDATPDLVADVFFPVKHQISRGTIRVDYGDLKWLSGEQQPHENQRIARSQRLGNIAEAKQQCTDNAVEVIAKIAHEHAQRNYVDEGDHETIPFDVNAEVRKRIDSFVVDEFVQGLETRDVGTAYRCAMLLDLTELNTMFVDLNINMHNKNKTNWAWTTPYVIRFGSVIGLVMAVTLIYLVLDATTQGYYNGRIKTGLTVFGIVGLVILFLVTA